MNNKLPVTEIFKGIQGEGIFSGITTFFVRFWGCDFNCTWCDEPQHKAANPVLVADDVYSIMEHLDRSQAAVVTLTGGNPCIRDLSELVRELKLAGFKIHVETQGSMMPDWLRDVDFITISPKGPSAKNKTDLFELQKKLKKFSRVAKQLKPVIMVDSQGNVNEEDVVYLKQLRYVFPGTYLIAQMGDDGTSALSYGEKFNKLCNRILDDPELKDVRVMPQLHKIAGIR